MIIKMYSIIKGRLMFIMTFFCKQKIRAFSLNLNVFFFFLEEHDGIKPIFSRIWTNSTILTFWPEDIETQKIFFTLSLHWFSNDEVKSVQFTLQCSKNRGGESEMGNLMRVRVGNWIFALFFERSVISRTSLLSTTLISSNVCLQLIRGLAQFQGTSRNSSVSKQLSLFGGKLCCCSKNEMLRPKFLMKSIPYRKLGKKLHRLKAEFIDTVCKCGNVQSLCVESGDGGLAS